VFTGLVEEIGVVERIESAPAGRRIAIRARLALEGTGPGASVAVNGVCLTVIRIDAPPGGSGRGRLVADVLGRTWEVTALGALGPGSAVNLERALRAGDRMGGHFVLGHVDGTGVVESRRTEGGDRVLRIAAPPRLAHGFVPRGSVAVDGVSLTVARVHGRRFEVHCIPATLERTTLGRLRPGARVNLETDILGKYAQTRSVGGITAASLEEKGF
jgi:riboflavin synthase